jgi:hypothetical protein
MENMNDRITLRFGNLAGPLAEAATKAERTVSEEIRVRLAKSLGVDEPDMAQGFAAMTEKKAAMARKKSARTRHARK